MEKSENSRNQGFFFFCLLMEGSGSGSYKSIMDPNEDPGGPKTYGSYGSVCGSGIVPGDSSLPVSLERNSTTHTKTGRRVSDFGMVFRFEFSRLNSSIVRSVFDGIYFLSKLFVTHNFLANTDPPFNARSSTVFSFFKLQS
jgi:hypothetical protein